MTTFTIDPENSITAYASLKDAQAADIGPSTSAVRKSWPSSPPPGR